jgi:hypothetical protein
MLPFICQVPRVSSAEYIRKTLSYFPSKIKEKFPLPVIFPPGNIAWNIIEWLSYNCVYPVSPP